MWRRIFALMKKEFLALLKNKSSRMVIIGPPVIQLIIFGYAASYDLNQVKYAVYNEDPGAASRELISRFAGSKTFNLVDTLRSQEEIAPLINTKKALMVLHLERDFTKNLLLNRPADIQLIVDGRDSNTALILLGYARSIINRFSMKWAGDHGGKKPPAEIVMRAWFNPTLSSRWFIIPGIVGLLTLVVTLLVTSLSVAREREAGTFDQLLVTPLTPFEILVGKALPGFIIGTAEASFIIFMAAVWFKVPLIGGLLPLYLGIVLFLLSAIGVGLMISSMCVTQQQGLFGAFMFLVPSIILSGFATPIANMPVLLQRLTLINPLRYFLIVLRGVFLQGASVSLLIPQFWPMAVIGIVSLAMAGWLFRHKMY
ncbi:MAG: ABC transporter permease [Deltaproteobacteria bacterium]|nr:ABC transporter permease [Deltaproteobacteria bacterium]